MKKPEITPEQMSEVLDKCYNAAIQGLPKMKSCTELADEYRIKYSDLETSAQKFISYQIIKCSTSGFITSLGGLITLPVSVPANVASVLYVQIRMIATLAAMAGYDINDDSVQTIVYACLAGTSVSDVFKSAGVKIANKSLEALIKKIPGTVLTRINKAVGFRLITKFGTTGIINLGKMIPIAGGFIGGGVDFASTKIITKCAYKTFILNDIN